MLATLAEPPLTGAGLRLRAEVRRHPRPGARRAGESGARACGLWSRLGNEKTRAVPVDRSGARDMGRDAQGAGAARRRDRGARSERAVPPASRSCRAAFTSQTRRTSSGSRSPSPSRSSRSTSCATATKTSAAAALTDRRPRPQVHGWSKLDRPRRRCGSASRSQRTDAPVRARANQEGWEGLIVKEAKAPYQTGRRSPSWRKLKVVNEQEFVVGGWTEPRQARQDLRRAAPRRPPDERGALKYVGHTGTGFDSERARTGIETAQGARDEAVPFSDRFKTNEPAHWVTPDLVAQVRFTEWTADQKLRHPVYLGLRDRQESHRSCDAEGAGGAGGANECGGCEGCGGTESAKSAARGRRYRVASGRRAAARAGGCAARRRTIELPDGSRLGVTNPAKIFWPKLKLTKGDLLRYYATVAPLILPVVEDRPLVMKRFPNGIDATAFYQQRSPHRETARRRAHRDDRGRPRPDPGAGRAPLRRRIADHAALHDADRRHLAGPVVLARAVAARRRLRRDRPRSRRRHDVRARARRRAARARRAAVAESAAVPKTSGSSGLHIYIPLAPGTLYESGMLFCQIIANGDRVAPSEDRHRRAHGARAAQGDGVRGLPAEHPRQDARDRATRLAPATTRACRHR